MKNALEELQKRNIPDLLTFADGKEKVQNISDFERRREELKKIIQDNIYGILPKPPEKMEVETVDINASYMGGKAIKTKLRFTVTVDGDSFSFPVGFVKPKAVKNPPAFVYIGFGKEFPDDCIYFPIEDIIDEGFAAYHFEYKNVTNDNGDFSDGIAKLFIKDNKRAENSPGKIIMWAWCAMRIMDYIEERGTVDSSNVAVIGHSRLGKTALLTSALDERFKYAISNNSGCTGAAITRGKGGEQIEDITKNFPYWFAEKYSEYAKLGTESLPCEQNFLTALTAPRHLIVGSAEDDLWADPESEFLGALAANEAYKIYGMAGLIHDGYIPTAKAVLDKGDACYHIRRYGHMLSREDWRVYMNFIKSKI